MTETAVSYTTNATPPPVNEDALLIAADMAGIRPATAREWIRAALAGTVPMRSTYGWEVWICYQTAVRAFEISRRPKLTTP